ncbi:MAG: lipoyl domain-containing protein, partial [Elusimicrobiota bacterium]
MLYEFRLPDTGAHEAELLGWEVREGEKVAPDQILCRVLAGKAEHEIRCPQSGVLIKQVARIGDLIRVAQLVAILRPEGAATPAEPAPLPPAADFDPDKTLSPQPPAADKTVILKPLSLPPAPPPEPPPAPLPP